MRTPTPLLASMSAPGERQSLAVVHGRGARLTLEDGRETIDAGSLSSCLLGHCHPELVGAVQDAAATVYAGDGVRLPAREAAARDMLELAFAGEDWADQVVFTVSSSEAADLGLLLAQLLTGREPLVARESGYHGGVGLAREVSLHRLWGATLASPDGGVLERPPLVETRVLPVPGCGRGEAEPGHDCRAACLRSAGAALDGAAAVILDCSQGAVVPSPGYQEVLAEAAAAAGALSIADETVTALGRLGRSFAFQRATARPDLVTMGKGITGGAAPAGALILSRGVVDEIGGRRWMTSSTFRGHPLAVAAISATLRVIARDGLVERAARLGEGLGRALLALPGRHPSVRSVYGEGLMWFVRLHEPVGDLGEDVWGGDGSATPLARVVSDAILERGVVLREFSGEMLWLVPPLVIEERELELAVEALDEALGVADAHLAHARGGAS